MNRLRAIYRGQKASVSQNRQRLSLPQTKINAAILQICFLELLWIITYNPENLFCHHVQLWTTNESEEHRSSLWWTFAWVALHRKMSKSLSILKPQITVPKLYETVTALVSRPETVSARLCVEYFPAKKAACGAVYSNGWRGETSDSGIWRNRNGTSHSLSRIWPMRRGEICALDSTDISGNIVHVSKNMVRTEDNTWIIKSPKSYAGDRYIDFPDFVAEKWRGKTGRIVNLTPNNITDRFRSCLHRLGFLIFASMICDITLHLFSTHLAYQTVISCSVAAGEMTER